jgi:manganese/iron transport system permease protein
MTELIEVLADPWTHVFMRRAFAVAVMAGIVCGVVGTFVVLRGMAFIGDAVAHAVFPGVAIGFALQVNLALAGGIAGVVTAVGVALVSQHRRLKEDAVIGVFFAFAFALGIVVLSSLPNYTGDLASFLFGQLLGVSDEDVWTVAVLGALLVAGSIAFRKEIVTVALDRETARASGLSPLLMDIVVYVMVTVAIVISLQAVGNILVLALLITPAATARMLTDRLGTMMALSAAIGGLGCLAGLYVSYGLNLAAGGLIVLILTAWFGIVWLVAPRHGLLARILSRRGDRSLSPRSLPKGS